MIYSLKQVENNDFDIFHPTFFDSYFLPYLKKPFVMTIHDMAPEIFNFSKEQIRGKIKQATRASRIIAVSENTKKDIIRYLNVPEEKIEVIYHGYVPSEVDNHTKSIIEGPYILYVGDRSIAYKNFSYFTRQIAIFLGSHKEFKMVCTGKEFSKEELLMFNNLGIEKKIIHLFCNTSELNNLYVHAFSFVYPSIYEGFGIPILEAFNANCLVILNKKSCFPEIAKDGALYFDSDNEDKKLSTVLEDVFSMSNSDRQNLIIKGKNRLKKFSWVKSAEKLSNIYRDISEGVQ
jgi:glycosyltransferase involved in cell wall biosynthesis